MIQLEVEYVETVIVGAGQQGCGVAAALQDLGHESVVVERREIGQAWAHERWDSLRVGSGNRSVQFPGWEYDGDDPDGHMLGPELARHLRRYVEKRKLRVRQHTPVLKVECPQETSAYDDVRFRTHLPTGIVESRNLVAAVGGYARPRVPSLASQVDPAVNQVHSSDYRNPGSLAEGAVLVVGTGISGQQIADELLEAGREVFLSVGRHSAWPHHYRGRSIHEWMRVFALYEDFVRQPAADGSGRPVLPGLPVTASQDWNTGLNLGTLAGKGVVLVGSTRAAQHDVLLLEDNVVAIAAEADRSFRRVTDKIDTGIRKRGFAVPEQDPAGIGMEHISDFGSKLHLGERDITTIIWCTGFGPDYQILPDHVLDDDGAPIQDKGIFGAVPGLYYAGLPDGDSLAPVAISANIENGRVIAHNVHFDHVSRPGRPATGHRA
ncbi:flavin-containing monooxygenase [Actinomadura terrae]|uniref:flavin-containing monooxygenase n=1 Tax=Actinomadura terrae TaxID=604353 RepID=UPI001FA7C6BE|nr:NAD(P)/FAD-dependent oxidoreductase [Actinomadura terrae]